MTETLCTYLQFPLITTSPESNVLSICTNDSFRKEEIPLGLEAAFCRPLVMTVSTIANTMINFTIKKCGDVAFTEC